MGGWGARGDVMVTVTGTGDRGRGGSGAGAWAGGRGSGLGQGQEQQWVQEKKPNLSVCGYTGDMTVGVVVLWNKDDIV